MKLIFRLADEPEKGIANYTVPDGSAIPRVGESLVLFDDDDATYTVERVCWMYASDQDDRRAVVFFVSRKLEARS